MRRRDFISCLGGAAMVRSLAGAAALLSSHLAKAEPADKLARIGILTPQDPFPPWIDAFRAGLRELGYVEGRTVAIELRSAAGKKERYPQLIAELLRLKVDVFMTWSTPTSLALKQAAGSTPIVSISGDPVGLGLAASLAHPGGNLTGFAIMTGAVEAKQIQILKDTVPNLARIAVLWNPTNPAMKPDLDFVRHSAPQAGLSVQSLPVSKADQFDDALEAVARENSGALLVLRDDLLDLEPNRQRIAALAIGRRLPTMFGWREGAQAGGLLAYGVDFADLFRRAAVYVDKILKGAASRDLPIAQPEKFELFVNLRTAQAIGLAVPAWLLASADEVIE
jgi:putative tryptophan/tyrosine transport system substrate-binding protein